MPTQVTDVSNLSVSFLSVIGILFTLFSIGGAIVSSYAVFVISTLNKQISNLKVSIQKDISEIKDNHKTLAKKSVSTSERLVRVETSLSDLKELFDKNF
jgi:predicted PurR-regulated permease PerM